MKQALWMAALLLVPLAALNGGDAPKRQGKPNILFIYADDWGWGDMSLHQSPSVRTPKLDQLFSQGTEFYQFHVNAPVCSPVVRPCIPGSFPDATRSSGSTKTPRKTASTDSMTGWIRNWSCCPG